MKTSGIRKARDKREYASDKRTEEERERETEI